MSKKSEEEESLLPKRKLRKGYRQRSFTLENTQIWKQECKSVGKEKEFFFYMREGTWFTRNGQNHFIFFKTWDNTPNMKNSRDALFCSDDIALIIHKRFSLNAYETHLSRGKKLYASNFYNLRTNLVKRINGPNPSSSLVF